MMNDQKRTWLKVFVALLILLPGLPYIMMLVILVLEPFDLSVYLFMPAIILHNCYFWLPALLFGDRLYPAEEFGYLPSVGGYVVAALLYGTVALGLSFPVSRWAQRLKTRKTRGRQSHEETK